MALFGTKTDLRDGGKKRTWEELEAQMQPIMDQYDVRLPLRCLSRCLLVLPLSHVARSLVGH